jgi:Transglutaminase-like superfamily/Coenzyme PQQ synthesis protein D (PqqD)
MASENDRERQAEPVGRLMPQQQSCPETSRGVRFTPSSGVKVSVHDSGIVFLCLATGRLFTANKTVAVIWQAVTAGEKLSTVCQNISHDCGVPLEHAQRDVEEFLAQLEQQGFVQREQPVTSRWRLALVCRALAELLRYDITLAFFGFGGIHKRLERYSVAQWPASRNIDDEISRALSIAASIYWKPVKCLQRSVVKTRLLRHRGIPADLVIGYRAAPFFSHAWVEVDGRVVSDPQGYSRRLFILERVRASRPASLFASAGSGQ